MKPDIIENQPLARDDEGPLSRRLGWFVALWLVSVGILSAVAIIIRWAIN